MVPLAILVLLVPQASWGFFSFRGKNCGPLEVSVFQKYLLRKPFLTPTPDVEEHYHYGYDIEGPANWSRIYEQCGGRQQSPIDICLSNTKYDSLPQIAWSDLYQQKPKVITVANTEKSVSILQTYATSERPTITGGPLKSTYALEEIHFHWGTVDSRGSEHTINGKKFPMEMHAVHLKQNLTMAEAIEVPGGIAVVGYFVEIQNTPNEAFANLQEVFSSLSEVGKRHPLKNVFPPGDLVLPFCKGFVTYQGSLTTPPCSEAVTWILSPRTIGISKQQLENFRSLYKFSKKLQDNFRPVQDLNGRKIIYSIK